MDLFKVKFLNEAADLINNLEESVLSLENNREDGALIEQIFRVMHTFKGNSNMFGFDKIGEFTHHLETIYDLVRAKKILLSQEIVNITLFSVDHIKNLLKEDKEQNGEVLAMHTHLLSAIKEIIGKFDENKIEHTVTNLTDLTGGKMNTFHISFQPNKDILIRGNNIFYLLDDLLALGEGKAFPKIGNLPGAHEADFTSCYLEWDIFLATSESESTIKEVFMFVEGECELKITCISKDCNSFKEDKFFKEASGFTLFSNNSVVENLLKQANEKASMPADAKLSSKTVLSNKEASNIKVSSDKLDELMSLVSELVTTQARLSQFSEESKNTELNVIAENIEKISRRLRDNTFNICLVPIGSMHTRFKRLVRDLGNELNKEVNFKVEGAETELDKTIVENLTDPLLHIIRNSMDHGIEKAEDRIKSGKPANGSILLRAYNSGANVHIEIIDDGAGLDPEKIKHKALEKSLINEEDKLSKKEIFDLIFLPGFSTAETVTGISGRGVGMDVVSRNIKDLRGDIVVESTLGEGTKITIILPLTLSIIDGLLVKIEHTHFIIPLSAVEKCYEVKHEVFENNFKELIILDGEQYPYLYLRDEFNLKNNTPTIEQVIVVKNNDKQIGISVDSIVGEYQAVLKPLGKLYRSVQTISGATILGDGSVALVMDINQMIKQHSIQYKELAYEK